MGGGKKWCFWLISPYLVEELVEEPQVMGSAEQCHRCCHQEHSNGTAHGGEQIHGDAEDVRGWGQTQRDTQHRDGDPLSDVVTPNGDGTLRGGDKPKVPPTIAMGTPCEMWWHQMGW